MYKNLLLTSCICILTFIHLDQAFVAWSCAIESGPIKELAEYSKSVDARITELRKEASNMPSCGAPIWGVVSSVDRTISTVDGAFSQIPNFLNLFLDFLYNIKLAISGEARSPVMNQGKIFNQIENKITKAIDASANRCALSESISQAYVSLLRQNQALENIFKQAALGTPATPTWLSTENIIVANAINLGYIPPATESCKDLNGTQDPIATIQKAIEFIGAKNESALSDWKKAIAMFQGWWSSISAQEYSQVQRKLLQAELSRQGFSPRMAQSILGNFDCVKLKTQWDDSIGAAMRARTDCPINIISGLENITLLPLRKSIDAAKTTDDRVYAVNKLSDRQKIVTAIETMNVQLKVMTISDIDIKSAIMSNLIDIHLELLSTSEAIEKRIPIMYANCMKAQPSVACPKP